MRTGSLSLSIATGFVLGCSSARHEPFAVPEPVFFDTVKTIVLAPVAIPTGIEFAESLLIRIDSMVEVELNANGFETVPSASYDSVWNRILDEVGPLYDPNTGLQDDEKLGVAREQLFVDLIDLYHPDAVLFPEIEIVDAQFSEGVAEWDGVSEPLVGFGARMLGAFAAAFLSQEGDAPYGSVDALSLLVVIENMDGVELFVNAGGIQVLQKLNNNGSYRDVSDRDLLTDPDRTRKAVTIALKPLAANPN